MRCFYRGDTHMVGYVGVSSVTQVLLHYSHFVLHGCCQEQLLIHNLWLEDICKKKITYNL